jgi:ubiquinone/menaquinone biosynthesis C-methylase UbiE
VSIAVPSLSDRQLREIQYHKSHAALLQERGVELSYDVLTGGPRRWWNASWAMYGILLKAHLAGRRVLVAGCGLGEDAIRLSRLGAQTWAFDLSPDMLAGAAALARREEAAVTFDRLPAERLSYADSRFDCIVIRDILHHVDIPAAMAELTRVAAEGALFVINEVYSHSLLERIRRTRLVTRRLYPRLAGHIYQGAAPYITPDERKLNQHDLRYLRARLKNARCQYFSCFITRLLAPSWTTAAKLDRRFLQSLGPAGRLLASRLLLSGTIRK